MAEGDELATAVADAPEQQDAPADAAADLGAPEQTDAEPTPEQRIAALETERDAARKEANDFKSQAVGRQSAADRDEAIHARFDALQSLQVRMMEAVALKATDPDKADSLIEDLTKESAALAATQKSAEQWGAEKAEFTEDLVDILEGSGLTAASPALAETARAWQTADAAQDRVGMRRALRLARRAVADAAKATPEAPPKRDAKASLEMATTPTGGAAPESDDAIWQAYGRGESKMNDKVLAAGKALGYIQ